MNTEDKIIEIFCHVDDFCKKFEKAKEGFVLPRDTDKKTRNKPCKLSDSEVITILIYFHLKRFRNLKVFYTQYVQKHMTKEFPHTVSYNRFVELEQKAIMPMVLYLQTCCLGKCTGISFIDSTKLAVCNNKRIHSNKVFKGFAERGHTTTGWFYGFKLHIIINDKGELLSFTITQGNTDDRAPLANESFTKKVMGKLFGDKGYLGEKLFAFLFVNGIQLITKLRKNMKGKIMSVSDSILLRKRAVIESVNDELKNMCQIEHTRHRCFANFISNMISGLIAYSFFPKKPAIQYETVRDNQLALFY